MVFLRFQLRLSKYWQNCIFFIVHLTPFRINVRKRRFLSNGCSSTYIVIIDFLFITRLLTVSVLSMSACCTFSSLSFSTTIEATRSMLINKPSIVHICQSTNTCISSTWSWIKWGCLAYLHRLMRVDLLLTLQFSKWSVMQIAGLMFQPFARSDTSQDDINLAFDARFHYSCSQFRTALKCSSTLQLGMSHMTVCGVGWLSRSDSTELYKLVNCWRLPTCSFFQRFWSPAFGFDHQVQEERANCLCILDAISNCRLFWPILLLN